MLTKNLHSSHSVSFLKFILSFTATSGNSMAYFNGTFCCDEGVKIGEVIAINFCFF